MKRCLLIRRVRSRIIYQVIFGIFLFSAFTIAAKAQQSTVSGTVKSAEKGVPLAGVSIRIEGTNRGTTSNAEGHFELQASTGDVLSFSYLGYLSHKVRIVNPKNNISVKLSENVKELNSVVVVGYGTQKKENLTGALSTLDVANDRKNQPITNINNALHGVSGLYVEEGQSMPGTDRASIVIRGMGTFGSIDDNAPLVLVDGVEYPMYELNPDDIATVTVLKDASAAIYGSRAANGVILVTTKKGKGKAHINYSYYYGVQSPTLLPDLISDPIAYMKLMNEAAANEEKAPFFTDDEIQEYEFGMKIDPFTYPAINWYKRMIEPGTIQKHDLSLSGASGKVSYRFSLGRLTRDGIIEGPSDKEKKYSLGVSTSVQATPKLRVDFNLDGYYRYYSQPAYTNSSFWQYMARTIPIENDTLADGNYGYPYLRVPGRNNWENPRMIANEGSFDKWIQRFVASIGVNYKLPWNLTYDLKFGLDKFDGFEKLFIPEMFKMGAKGGPRQNWNSPSTAPRSTYYDWNERNIHFYNTLNWKKTFAKSHHVNVMAGASYDSYWYPSFSAEVIGYLDATLDALDAGTTPQAISGNETLDRLESYFGRVNYDYKGKYLLEGIFRADGSAKFAPGHRWGFFPGVSAGWRIDKENFFSSNFIDLLKLRASYGKLGNNGKIGLYNYENAITLGHYYSFGGANGELVQGAAATAYTDPTTTWETTTSYDIGVDLNMWNNRINVTADVYKKVTTGILHTVNLPAHVGDLTGPVKNVGRMYNEGYEIQAQYRDNVGPFSYKVYGNVSYNKNMVTYINGERLYNLSTNEPTIVTAGHPMNAFYIYDAIGFFQDIQDISKSPYQESDITPGDIKYRDVNNDGKIDGDDRIIIDKSSRMPLYNYAFGFNLGYKGLSLDVFFQGIAKMEMFQSGYPNFPLNNGANALNEWLTDAWTPDNPNASLPIIKEASFGSKNNYRASTFWLQDASYLRLKNVQLSYSLPKKWVEKVKMEDASIFVNAENPLLFSKFRDYDPETITNYTSIYHYPMLKTYSAGINVSF